MHISIDNNFELVKVIVFLLKKKKLQHLGSTFTFLILKVFIFKLITIHKTIEQEFLMLIVSFDKNC